MNHYLILTIGVLLGAIAACFGLVLRRIAHTGDQQTKSHLSDDRIAYINSSAFAANWPRPRG